MAIEKIEMVPQKCFLVLVTHIQVNELFLRIIDIYSIYIVEM